MATTAPPAPPPGPRLDAPSATPEAAAQRVRGTVRLLRVSGIEIEAHWSWLFIVALLVWSLSATVFPLSNPHLSDATYVAMGAAAALLLFVSLSLHELGHALQAQREGMRIDGITLWLLGGVARFAGRFPSAGAELRIAVAGPLVSLAIGVVLLTAALALPLPGALDGVLHWLGTMNLVLLVFNMIPALPLDGGRVLRAVLWGRSGDLSAATRTAVAISIAVGRGLIAGGIALVLLTGLLGGAWLALIGWFLLNAAHSEALLAATAGARQVLVAEVMVPEPVTVPVGMSLARFLEETVSAHRHVVYPVTLEGQVVGLISFRDALRVRPGERTARTVEDTMVPLARVATLDADRPLTDALGTLLAAPLRRALVTRDGAVAGLLSTTDALRAIELLRGS